MATFCSPFYSTLHAVLSILCNIAYLANRVTEISHLGEHFDCLEPQRFKPQTRISLIRIL